MHPGCLSALSSCNSLAPFLPTGGPQDANLPGNSGSSSHCLPVCAMSRWQAELEVAKLWRARWPLVHGRGCPWGVLSQCTPSRQTILVCSRPGCGTGVGGVAANGRRCWGGGCWDGRGGGAPYWSFGAWTGAGAAGNYAGDSWHLGRWSKWPGGWARHQLEGLGKCARCTGGVAAPGWDRWRAGLLALGGRIGGRGSPPRERCGHLRGGDWGSRAINMRPAGRFGGAHWAGTTLGNWAKPPAHGYGGWAAQGCGLAAPHTLASGGWATAHVSCSLIAACARFRVTCGHPCGLLTHPWCSCGVPATPCPCSRCGVLATLGCLCSCPTSSPVWANLPLGCACQLQVPELWWPIVGWGSGAGGVAGASPRPGWPWPLVALPTRFPHPTNLFLKEIEIHCHAWESERKSRDRFCHGRYQVFRLPKLWLIPMPWQMTVEEEKHFWSSQDLVSAKALELGIPPKDVQMAEVGKWVIWGPVIEPAPEGPPLVPLGEAP